MDIPCKFLFDSSRGVIGEYALSRLNLAANLKKEMRASLEQVIDSLVEARFARWLLENREELCDMACSIHVGQKVLNFGSDSNRQGEPEFGPAYRFGADAAD